MWEHAAAENKLRREGWQETRGSPLAPQSLKAQNLACERWLSGTDIAGRCAVTDMFTSSSHRVYDSGMGVFRMRSHAPTASAKKDRFSSIRVACKSVSCDLCRP